MELITLYCHCNLTLTECVVGLSWYQCIISIQWYQLHSTVISIQWYQLHSTVISIQWYQLHSTVISIQWYQLHSTDAWWFSLIMGHGSVRITLKQSQDIRLHSILTPLEYLICFRLPAETNHQTAIKCSTKRQAATLSQVRRHDYWHSPNHISMA